jgi:hypothetical protein
MKLFSSVIRFTAVGLYFQLIIFKFKSSVYVQDRKVLLLRKNGRIELHYAFPEYNIFHRFVFKLLNFGFNSNNYLWYKPF